MYSHGTPLLALSVFVDLAIGIQINNVLTIHLMILGQFSVENDHQTFNSYENENDCAVYFFHITQPKDHLSSLTSSDSFVDMSLLKAQLLLSKKSYFIRIQLSRLQTTSCNDVDHLANKAVVDSFHYYNKQEKHIYYHKTPTTYHNYY